MFVVAGGGDVDVDGAVVVVVEVGDRVGVPCVVAAGGGAPPACLHSVFP